MVFDKAIVVRLLITFVLVVSLSACVNTQDELAMTAATPNEAKQKAALTPIMRRGIAEAVAATQPFIRTYNNTVLISGISGTQDGGDPGSYRAFYCVHLVLQEPLMNWDHFFIIYPTDLGNGNYRFRTQWKFSGILYQCQNDLEYSPFPELKALFEHPPIGVANK